MRRSRESFGRGVAPLGPLRPLGAGSPGARLLDRALDVHAGPGPARGRAAAGRGRASRAIRSPAIRICIERFAAVGPGGEAPVPGVPNTEPAGFVAFAAPGLYTIVYDSGRSPVELDAAKFETYLNEEGLEAVSAARASAARAPPGRTRSSRAAPRRWSRWEAAPGAPGSTASSAAAGAGAGEEPLYAQPGEGSCRVRLLYEGKPLAGALVMALQRGRSDRGGRAARTQRGAPPCASTGRASGWSRRCT